ncbi:hypothetical protein, partial [Bifidobacterium longum]|uniref:hypothetical protein n=3 Tax=Bifidobacterium longum TaxID=216816 RepID=UPI001F573FF9
NQDSESGKAGQARPDDVASTHRNKTHILSFNPESIAAEIIAIEISTVTIVIKAIVSSIIAVEFNLIVADQPVVTVISQRLRHVIMGGNALAAPIAGSALPCYREAFRIVILSRMRHDIAPLSQR